MELKEMKCKPCEGGVAPLTKQEVDKYRGQVSEGWKTNDYKKIRNEFSFNNFKQGMEFVNRLAEIAEEEQHHPDVCIHYSKVEVELWTHAIGGLSENDFIMAAKIDELKH